MCELVLSWWKIIWCRTLYFLCSSIVSGKQTVVYQLSFTVPSFYKRTVTTRKNLQKQKKKKNTIIFFEALRTRITFVSFTFKPSKQSISILFRVRSKYRQLFHNVPDMFWSTELNLLRFSSIFAPVFLGTFIILNWN